MTLSERSVNKPTTVLMIFLVLVAFGIYSALSLPIDLYPDMELPYIAIMTTYENAGPEEVEQSVTRVLESSLSGVTGLKTMQSQSMTGSSLIYLEMNYGVNLDEAVSSCRDKIDMVRKYLPTDSDSPVMFKMDPSMIPIMGLAIKGNRTPEELRKLSEDVIQKKLEQIDGVASAYINGGREKCIRVDIPRERLEAYNLTISEIAQLLGAQNVQSAGGAITSGDINYTIQAAGKYKSLDDVRNTVISWKTTSAEPGSVPLVRTIKLRDIADVYEGYKKETTLAFMNGEPCVSIMIQKQSGKNSVQSAKRVRKQIEILKGIIPSDVQIIEVWNTTDSIEATIKAVIVSVIEGAILAILVLILFLRSVKSTLIIGISIPVSLLVTLVLMWLKKMSVNMISLAGLLIGVGMLVDNSIVVLENIYSYRQKDAKPKVAAVLGSQEMVSAITSSTLTTVCIFLPMIMLKSKMGMVGQFLDDLSVTIIFSLMCSLVVAVTLVPVLASSYLIVDNTSDRTKTGPVSRAIGNFFDRLDSRYSKAIAVTLRHKKIILLTIIVLMILSIAGVVYKGAIFMPESESSNVSITVDMPKGTKLEITEGVVKELESIITQELKGIKHLSSNVGGGGFMSSSSDTNTATIRIKLYDEKDRKPGYDSAASAKDKIRPYMKKFPGAEITFGRRQDGMGQGLVVDVRCDDLKKLASVTKEVEELIKEKGTDWIDEVSSNLEDGLPEVKIVFDRDLMYSLGLNVYTIGAEIKANIDGKTATRYEDNGTEIDLVVSLAEEDKARLSDLDSIFVTTQAGTRIPLSVFAHYEESTAPVSIMRKEQGRMTQITCNPKKGLAIQKIQSEINTLIKTNIPQDENVSISFSGDNEDLKEAGLNFLVVIIMAAVLVFTIMASQFESFKDPFIVIFTIPLSFIGVVIIYYLSGQKFSMVSIFGFLMLVGMIVNNGIVLVDYTNLLRHRGYELFEACVEAARSRLRPILMSTLTTVISLIPMSFFPNEGTEMIQPISMTVLGGLSFGSLMTLFVMPSLYFYFNSKELRKLAKINRKIALLEERKFDEKEDPKEIKARIERLEKLRTKYERRMAKKNARIVSVAKRKVSVKTNKIEEAEEE
ncbi:MAG: efflux RND transporter permease subunit [Treponema sp.]|uniref:efflux RND transporter permease subunit n=1 Tax=Treponema sp. TaxID=166 RepID=UPI00298DB7EE|nr:efflux RND transporter permease subunit [Treponema sp.]MBR0154855.1 efflux RND transporter permease subunit [Treponema sp.]MCR5387193.1 efflux RND transporter permease subunit [Treponema sp.]